MRVRLGVIGVLLLSTAGGLLAGCSIETTPRARERADASEDGGDDVEGDGGRGHDAGGHGDAGDRDAGRDDAGKDAGKDSGTDAGKDADADTGPVDPCASVSCSAHASCVATASSTRCECVTGYQDRDDDGTCEPACAQDSCDAHEDCSDATGQVACSCASDYQDNDDDGSCELACATDTCSDHSTCADGSGSVVCTCLGGYQDNDHDGTCLPACASTSCPVHATCADDAGSIACTCTTGYSGAACSDTDACALADATDGNPCNAVDDDASCSDDAAPATTYRCTCSSGFVAGGGSCVDVDECATANGGCGAPAFYSCENNVGAAPDCADIDECATNNGGCGAAAFYRCTNNAGAAPGCADIDECATDNGGCGNLLRGTCANHVGAPPTCTCTPQYGGPGCAYHQVYGLDLPIAVPAWSAQSDVPYEIDNTAAIASFDRVAYRLQLDDQWVWVEFDAFTDQPSSLGIPADEVWDQQIAHLTVRTNGDAVDEVTDVAGGKMELWSACYTAGLDGAFDGDDEPASIDCFGSLQFHLDNSTLLAVNHWAADDGGNVDVGIGPSDGGNVLDWTYFNNAGDFTTRRLDVYVRELASCAPDSCNGRGSCGDGSGIVVCDCDDGYDGVHCQACVGNYQDNDSDGVCEPRCAPGSCTTPGEYCFDDSGAIECLVNQGDDCASILAANALASNGGYVVDLDGPGGNDPRFVYCDMAHGGFTLLAVADAQSPRFGNNSPVWSQSSVFGSTSIGLAGGDYKSNAYAELATDVIRLCFVDLGKCHEFAHGLGIPLQSFFADDISYDEFASNIVGHANVGTDAARVQFLADIGADEDGSMCGYWLGINEQSMASGIGLMGDENDGCGAGTNNGWIDDVAIGVGLQSCGDANSCAPLGSKNTAGRQFGWTGEHGDLGPWLILGR